MARLRFLALCVLLIAGPGSCWTGSDSAAHAPATGEVSCDQGEVVQLVEQLLKARLEEQQAAHSQRLDHLETLVAQQAHTISSLERRLHSQDARMAYQARLLRAQAETLQGQQDSMGQLRATVTRLQGMPVVASSDLEVRTDRHNLTAGGEGTGQSPNQSTSQSHAVRARADDAEPLEAVVNQVSQQVTQLDADLQAFKTQSASDLQTLRDSNSQQDQHIQNAQTSTFVRWGNSQCGQSSQLVYSGVVGGSPYTDSGGATNYLCLTMDPVFANNVPSVYAHAFLVGGEYETPIAHYNHDPVCAVCRSSHSTTIMIPGTNVCTPGWQQQYSGYLMAGYVSHAAGSEFICVDSALESLDRSSQDQNGKLLYFTATRCGSLPCGPYVDDKVVTCVVCSL